MLDLVKPVFPGGNRGASSQDAWVELRFKHGAKVVTVAKNVNLRITQLDAATKEEGGV
jgi:hypothetical protein